ncbi:MAG: DNA polymerase/3'-5' exonuclease PolX [bacterium]|nr:DNA polymerase/3'-5' exonuclease PolX [bacterium]
MTRAEVVSLLAEYSVLLDVLGEDNFRAQAFANAARQLESVKTPLDELLLGKQLLQVRGIGASVVQAIQESAEKGTFADLEIARARVPIGVLYLMKLEGLGPKKARALWKDAKIQSLDDLEIALETGVLTDLPGFGGKTIEKFRVGLKFLKAMVARRLRPVAKYSEGKLKEYFLSLPQILSVHFCGSLRRGCETIGDLDCVICAETFSHQSLRAQLSDSSEIHWISQSGDIWSGKHSSGIEIELSFATPMDLGTKLILATGSKPHIAEIESRGTILIAGTEEEVYKGLGLAFVPPPLREGGLKLRTIHDEPYSQAITQKDLRGILHVHTTYSDGHDTLRKMAETMIKHNYEFLGIADHSKLAVYADGLTPERVVDQWKEIEYLNSVLAPFRILKGIECDILPDGRMDFDDALLEDFDFVIASIHSSFKMTMEQETDRLCRALENPHVDILGHPTGRLLLKREGYPIDHERVLTCAAQNGKAIELNCNPQRLDLDWRWFARALELKIPIPLNPDAHSISALKDIENGIELAAKGPIPVNLCPSAWSADEFLEWCNSHNRV